MAEFKTAEDKYSVVTRLFEKMNQISEDQLLIYLRELLQDSFSAQMFKMVIDMSNEQQALLLKKLESKSSIKNQEDRRSQSRKSCLVPADYEIQGRSFKGYILDISDSGAFIETSDYFFGGQDIIITFAVPAYQKPLKLTGKIVWSSEQGIGVKFTHLTPHQLGAVKYFSENDKVLCQI